ncbi:hypothetical protein [Nocardia sp. A7]|uniref:hypothetical protein n=1 Tax=Nocardia sp. A7 TaxID=2789274 RepID=UPI00397CB051
MTYINAFKYVDVADSLENAEPNVNTRMDADSPDHEFAVIGNWMLDSSGRQADRVGSKQQGRTPIEPVDLVFIDRDSSTPESGIGSWPLSASCVSSSNRYEDAHVHKDVASQIGGHGYRRDSARDDAAQQWSVG